MHSRCYFQQRSNLFNSHWKQLHKYFLKQSWAWISAGWEPQKAFISMVPPYPLSFNSVVQWETYLIWQYLYCINKSLSPKPAFSYSGVTVRDEMSVMLGYKGSQFHDSFNLLILVWMQHRLLCIFNIILSRLAERSLQKLFQWLSAKSCWQLHLHALLMPIV